MEDYWYKEAIIYEVHVKCFYDSSGDGIGDFQGLTQKLDYLHDLGVTAIWLLPFYPSPLKDDGYDISNYMDIHPSYGVLKDFRDFLKQAHRKGIKVITELVINHTSDQHPWFQRARKSKEGTLFRNYYVWSDSWNKYTEARIIFQDFETSNWTWDKEARSYFWHRFYSHQPDLNFEEEQVHRAIFKNLDFWLTMGVDGVRLDAVPYLYEKEGTHCENLPETHAFLKKLRTHVDDHYKDKMLLAEANQWPEDAATYFGGGDECHMVFHFPVMPRLFMAIHLEEARPILEIMGQTPSIPENCQWALFLRNHDELTLEMVTDEERDYMFRVYALDPQSRLNLGIRRRLAPLLKNDRRKIELMNVLLFSLNGTPIIYYGDEIGMGDNIYLGDRNGVRTPMQWSNDRNAGFSKANTQQLYLPPIMDSEYHYETINVEAQLNNPHSLLRWTKQLIALRKRFMAFSYGKITFFSVENKKLLVFLREFNKEAILVVTNLSRFPEYVELDLKRFHNYAVIEMFSGSRFPQIGELPYLLTLGAYGYYWFLLKEQSVGTAQEEIEKKEEKEVVAHSFNIPLSKIFQPGYRKIVEGLLKKYLRKRLKFRSLFLQIDKAKITIKDYSQLSRRENLHFILLEVLPLSGVSYLIPLFITLLKGEELKVKKESEGERGIALVHYLQEEMLIYDASEDPRIGAFFLEIIRRQQKTKTEKGELKGIKIDTLESSQLKIVQAFDEGIDPDIEMRLFLTRYTNFRSFIPLQGYIEYFAQHTFALAYAEKRIESIQEWSAKHDFIEGASRFLLRVESTKVHSHLEMLLPKKSLFLLTQEELPEIVKELFEENLEMARLLGNTTAQFHKAVTLAHPHIAFATVEYTLFYQRSIYQVMRQKVNLAFGRLKKEGSFGQAELLHEKLLQIMQVLPHHKFQMRRLRHHGNYTLENLKYTGREFVILNFGGRPFLSHAERKYKRSGLRDLASVFVSFYESGYEALEKLQNQGLIAEGEANPWPLIWGLWVSVECARAYFKEIAHEKVLSSIPQENDILMALFLIERAAEKIADAEHTKVEWYWNLLNFWMPIYESYRLS